jgi:hypothetical protein
MGATLLSDWKTVFNDFQATPNWVVTAETGTYEGDVK